MDEYISRKKAIDVIIDYFHRCEKKKNYTFTASEIKQKVADMLSDIPATNVVAVKHGKWEIYVVSPYEGTDVRCSECGQRGCVTYWDFCPNCGADMRGDKE